MSAAFCPTRSMPPRRARSVLWCGSRSRLSSANRSRKSSLAKVSGILASVIGIDGRAGGWITRDRLRVEDAVFAFSEAEESVPEIPKKYKHLEIEDKWRQRWDEWEIYKWDPSLPRDQTFVVDTPPPTVSGSLHVGHVFQLHPRRSAGALPADDRQKHRLPDGLGRQRPANRAPGAEPARYPLQPPPALRSRLEAGPQGRQAQGDRGGLAPQLHRGLRSGHG